MFVCVTKVSLSVSGWVGVGVGAGVAAEAGVGGREVATPQPKKT